MNKFIKSRLVKSMMPYLIFAAILMIFFRLTVEFRFFGNVIGTFFSIIAPFLTGAIIAYIFNLPCTAIQKLILKLDRFKIKNRVMGAVTRFIVRKSRAFALVLLILISVLIVVIILNILIPAISESIELFASDILPNIEATIRGWIANIYQLELSESITDLINEEAIVYAFTGWAQGLNFGAILGVIISYFGSAAAAIFHGFLATVSALYLLMEKDKFKAFVIRFVAAISSDAVNESILKFARKLDFNFRQYVFAQTIDGLILGSIMTIVLFAFGSPFFLVLGLILGIVNYIPYFGSIFGTALAVLVVAFTQGIWPTAVVAAIIMFAIQQFDGNFIQPKLMGKTFSLSPLLIIISVTIGMHYGAILGIGRIFGMLIAIPIVAILKDVVDAYIEHRENLKINPQPPATEAEEDFMDKDIW